MVYSREFAIFMDDVEPAVLIINKSTNQQQRLTGRAAKQLMNQIQFWEEERK